MSTMASDPRWIPVAINLVAAAGNEREPAFTRCLVFADKALTPSTEGWLRSPSCWGLYAEAGDSQPCGSLPGSPDTTQHTLGRLEKTVNCVLSMYSGPP